MAQKAFFGPLRVLQTRAEPHELTFLQLAGKKKAGYQVTGLFEMCSTSGCLVVAAC